TPFSASSILPSLRFGQVSLDEAEHFLQKQACGKSPASRAGIASAPRSKPPCEASDPAQLLPSARRLDNAPDPERTCHARGPPYETEKNSRASRTGGNRPGWFLHDQNRR